MLSAYGYAEAKSPIIIGDAERALRYSGNNLSSGDWNPCRSNLCAEPLHSATDKHSRSAVDYADSRSDR